MNKVIVSRHPAAIAFIGDSIHPEWHAPVTVLEGGAIIALEWVPFGLEPADPEFGTVYDRIPVIASATPADVTGKVVYGNLPMHLAALAAEVIALEFSGAPPRGAEYGLEEMRAAGARLVRYTVRAV